MKKSPVFLLYLFFLVISGALSLYLYLCYRSSSFTIQDHSLNPSWKYWLISVGGIFLVFLFFKKIFGLLENKINLSLSSHLGKEYLTYLPFALGFLSPLLLNYYLTRNDLQSRLKILGILMVLGFLLLRFLKIYPTLKNKLSTKKWINKFYSLPLGKRLFILFLVAFLMFNSCAYFFISQGKAFSGDEPYYLLTTHSLYQDQDINVANNYRNKDYFHFYPPHLFPHLKLNPYARRGRKGPDYFYPISQPGISVLMLPFYSLSQLFKGKILMFILKGSLSIWAVLLGLQIYLLSRELWDKEKLALLLWFLYSFSSPIIFYSFHLYPAIPIAFFSVYLFRKIRSPTPLTSLHYLFLGFLLSLFIWFGLKYNLIFWPFLLVSLYLFLKEQRIRWRIIYFMIFPVLSLALFHVYLYHLYGTFYPMAIYEGVITPEKLETFRKLMFKLPLMLRVDSFLDYFLDQRDGLLLYSPLYFFSFLGCVEIFRRNKKDLILLLLVSLPFLLNYAFFTHRQGYCPQGRVLTPVSWVGIILVGYFLAFNHKKFYSFLFWVAAGTGLFTAVILLNYPPFLYQPTTHQYTFRGGEYFIYLSNLYFYLPQYLPSFIKIYNWGYLPNYIWIGLIILFILGYTWKKNILFSSNFSFQSGLVLLTLLISFWWFVLFPKVTLIKPQPTAFPTGEKINFYSLNRSIRMKKPGVFYLSSTQRVYRFYFTSWYKIKKILLELKGEKDDEYKVKIKLFDLTLFKGKLSDKKHTLVCTSPPAYPYHKTHLYSISLYLENGEKAEPSAKKHFLFSIQPSY